MQVARIRPEAADVDPAAASYLRFLVGSDPSRVVYATEDAVLAIGADGAAVLGPRRGRAMTAAMGAALARAALEPFVFAMGPQDGVRGFVEGRGWKRLAASQEMLFSFDPSARSALRPTSAQLRAPSTGGALSSPFDAWMDAFVRELFAGPTRPPLVSAAELWTMWEGDTPVSMAGALNRGDDAIRIVTVYTPPELRGRGYASALVAGIATSVAVRGVRYVTLDYSLESSPSPRTAYERAGFRPTIITERWSA